MVRGAGVPVDPELLAETVASALDLGVPVGQDARHILADNFETRDCLLVLDNCEHLVAPVARLVSYLLRECAHLRLVATSRAPLGVDGEVVLNVPALAVPDPADRSRRSVREFDSVALFAQRAAGAVPDFELVDEDLRAIGEICYRLDGLPLAIELAAGRMRALTPKQILDRLGDPHPLLTGGSRNAPDRHRTLRASIGWSYELCTVPERLLWAGSDGLCRGLGSRRRRRDLRRSVRTRRGTGPAAVTREKSIVVRDQGGERVWYRMVETIRDFGVEKLNEADGRVDARRRHRDWYRQLLVMAEADWISSRQPYWLKRLYRELPNIRAALDFCLSEPGEAENALELTVPAWRICWWAHGRVEELRRSLDRVLAATTHPSGLRARALLVRAYLSGVQGDPDAEQLDIAAGRELAELTGDVLARSMVESGAAEAIAMDEPSLAMAGYLRALALLDPENDRAARMYLLARLAIVSAQAGAEEVAAASRHEVLTVSEQLGERFERSYLLFHLGVLAWRQGRAAGIVRTDPTGPTAQTGTVRSRRFRARRADPRLYRGFAARSGPGGDPARGRPRPVAQLGGDPGQLSAVRAVPPRLRKSGPGATRDH